jgi:hypothetical protein
LNVPGAVRNFLKLQSLHNGVGVHSKLQVLLVGKYEKGHILEVGFDQERHKLLSAFLQTHVIGRVHHKDKAIGVLVVVFPVGSDLALTSDIPDVKLEAILSL